METLHSAPASTRARWVPPLLLAAISIGIFAGSFWAEFTYDDLTKVVQSESIRHWHFWDLWSAGWKRSIRTLTLMVDHALFGDSPLGYHVHNVLWHALSTVLLYFLTRRISARPGLSFVVALLFAVHPVHVEAVANITNRKEMLCTAFMLASFLAYCRSLQAARRGRWTWLAVSAVAWGLALFSKQVAIALPLSLVSYEYLFVSREKRLLTRSLPVLLAGTIFGSVLVLGYMHRAFDFANLESIATLAGYSGDASWYTIALTSARAFWGYVALLLWPAGLCPDRVVELSQSLADPTTLVAWIGVAGWLVAALLLARRAPLVAFGLFWVLIHYLPISNLVPSAYIMADRYLYAPSAGFLLVLVCLGDALLGRIRRSAPRLAPALGAALCAVLLVGYAVRTLQYTSVWSSQRTLWTHALQCNPASARAHNGFGYEILEQGDHERALGHFTTAVALEPRFAEPFLNRATTLQEMGELDRAIAAFDEAVERWPLFPEIHYNRGNARFERREYLKAIADYTRAIELAADVPQFHRNRGKAWVLLGRWDMAAPDFERVVGLDPGSAEAHANLGACYGRLGDIARAYESYSAAADLGLASARDVLARIDAARARNERLEAVVAGPRSGRGRPAPSAPGRSAVAKHPPRVRSGASKEKRFSSWKETCTSRPVRSAIGLRNLPKCRVASMAWFLRSISTGRWFARRRQRAMQQARQSRKVALVSVLVVSLAACGEVRSIDGRDNNPSNPEMGAANAVLMRMMASDYADGMAEMAGGERPSPRVVSNHVSAQAGSIPNRVGASDMVWQWGQFLDHDIDLTNAADPLEPAPIAVPAGDPWFDPFGLGTVVIHFNRSVYSHDAPDRPREQLNEITSWIDASNVYGSDAVRAAALRTNDGTGRLRTSAGDLLPFNTAGLPNAGGSDPALFLAGDERANEQVGLTAMHTLFVREHNFWARMLHRFAPSLSGDELYEAARAMVGAEMQVITVREFLPALLGRRALAPYRGYDPSVDGRIANLFSTACYRFGHSMLSPELLRLDRHGREIDAGHLPLREAFFAPERLIEAGIEPLLRGLGHQLAQEVDPYVVDDVRNFLFGPPGAGGLDLASLNIQRGRDHGLPGYNAARESLGLARAAGFDDVSSDPEIRARLARAYEHVDQIDVWVGGLAEDRLAGALVGELVFTVLKNQFERLRDGDRFWYQNQFDGVVLHLLEGTRLSDVIRRNTRIGAEIPDDVFHVRKSKRKPHGHHRRADGDSER